MINPWVGLLPFPLTGSHTGSRVFSREATWREAGGRGWSCVNTTFEYVFVTSQLSVRIWAMWQPGYQEETVKRVRCKTEETTVTRFPMQRLSSLLVLKAAAYSAVSQKCLNFRNMEKRTKFIMQNSSLYLFHELLRIFKCVYVCHTVAQYFIAEVDKGLSCNCSWKLRRAAAFPALIYDSIQKRNKTLSAVVSVLATKRVGQLNLPWCSWYLLVQNPERSRLSSLKQLVKPDLSLFIQNRFTRSLYNQRLGGKKKKKRLWRRCSVLWKAAMNSLHKPSPEEEDVGRPGDSFYMHQQVSALLMIAHNVSHYQIPVDLLPGN